MESNSTLSFLFVLLFVQDDSDMERFPEPLLFEDDMLDLAIGVCDT